LILADLVMIVAAYRVAYLIRYRLEARNGAEIPLPETYVETVIVVGLCLAAVFAFLQLYIPRRGQSRIDLLYTVCLGVSAGFDVSLAAVTMMHRELALPRIVIVGWWGATILGVWIARVILDTGLRLGRAHGVDTANVLIVGAGESGEIILEKIRHAPELGYRVVGFV